MVNPSKNFYVCADQWLNCISFTCANYGCKKIISKNTASTNHDMKNSLIIALVLSLLVSIAILVDSCRFGTYEECLITQGLLVYAFGVLFLVIWAIIATLRALIRVLKIPADEDIK
jgi:hypothetical protein